MPHPDHETRSGAHGVFSILLMPSMLSPWSDQDKKTSEAVSEIFGASASQKRSKGFSFLGERKDSVDAVDGKLWEEGNSISNVGEKHDSHDHLNSWKNGKELQRFCI